SPYAVAAGILAGLSVLTRSVGVAVVAGLAAAAIHRRAYRQGALFCLVAAPFLLSGLLHAQAPPPSGETGWRQTWLWYSTYSGYFRISIPDLDVYLGMVTATWKELLETPAMYCLFPPAQESLFAGAFEAMLTVGILAGVVRQARRHGWKPLHFVFLFYAGMLLAWSPQTDRYLLLFLPMFYAGLWTEGKQLFGMLSEGLRRGRPLGERVLAGVVVVGLTSVALRAADHYVRGFRPQLREQPREWAALAVEKAQLYDWIRRNTDPEDRFVAYEDVNLYLFTGRQALRPIAFTAGALYPQNHKLLESELDHLTDVARHIGARYWVVTPDDFPVQNGREAILNRIARLQAALPVVFRSCHNRVQVVELSGWILPRDSSYSPY
ncbi:MAG: hypothetical protein HY238_09330, partial [Acidobacteria bacterium]|nr:hypothetical protein [Acidobacteriota bacterium]